MRSAPQPGSQTLTDGFRASVQRIVPGDSSLVIGRSQHMPLVTRNEPDVEVVSRSSSTFVVAAVAILALAVIGFFAIWVPMQSKPAPTEKTTIIRDDRPAPSTVVVTPPAIPGPRGDPGPKGEPGTTGTTGEKVTAGDTGSTGATTSGGQQTTEPRPGTQ